MCRRIASVLFLVFSIQIIVGLTGSAKADSLPVSVRVDLTGIALIGEFSDTTALSNEIRGLLEQHIREQLYNHWYVTPGVSNNVMELKIRQRTANGRLRIDLEISGDTTRTVSFRSIKPDTTPAMGDRFKEELVEAVQEFLFSEEGDIEAGSNEVYTDTNDLLETTVSLERPLSDEDRVRFRDDKLKIKWDHIDHFLPEEVSSGDRFEIPIILRPGDERHATLRPHIYQSQFASDALPESSLCVHRPMIPDPNNGTMPEVLYTCPLAGQCSLNAAVPVNWADQNCQSAGADDQGYVFPGFFGTAHAAPPKPAQWFVPDLDTLFDRLENHQDRFVGFSEFTIRARNLHGLDARSFSVEITANDVPILIDGQPSDETARQFDPAHGFFFRFGLENLQFAGRKDGCEQIEVLIRFLDKTGAIVDKVKLKRGYAALRDAHNQQFETLYGVFEWSGSYQAPTGRKENGIFLASALFKIDSEDERQRTLEYLNGLRQELDGFGWTIPAEELDGGLGMESVVDKTADLRIVGKIRPPRTVNDGMAAYGLQVGIEEPSGQLQFTFDREQQKALTSYLALRRDQSSATRQVVPTEFYIYTYTEERQSGPEWVCRD